MTLHAQKFIRATLRRLAPIVHTKRRGSVVVFAVAALAVMAIAAVAYLTVVRIERSSAAAYSRVINFQQQINAVVGEASALLAADLFGNKIVTNATPRAIDIGVQSIRISPRMFEDGGYLDFPQVHIGPNGQETFNYQRRQNPVATDSFTIDPRAENASRVAVSDDAWLASNTPIAPGFGAQHWSVWPQISNFRSAYRFNPDGGQAGLWVRDHGRFADLGQFWEQATSDNRGNPGADLSPDMLNDRPEIGPPVYSGRNGPWAGVDQQVFNRIMGEMAQFSDSTEEPRGGNFTPMDTRFWADTDGDGFPDARWQELDVLGELFGLRWVIAGRIIDNSALANVNAHIAGRNWQNPASAQHFADGLTPADVDLQRLLERYWTPFQQNGAKHPDIDNFNQARLTVVYRDHINEAIGAENIFEQIRARTPIDDDIFGPFRASLFHHDGAAITPPPNINPDYNPNSPHLMSRVHREVLWRGFGASPRRPVATSGIGYPLGDEVSLRAFHGFNYESLVSKVEQSFDGPEDADPIYLPPRGEGPYPGSERIGLMRSKEPGSTYVWRLPSHPAPTAQPQGYNVNNRGRIERIQRDVRRLLTTIGGAGDHSPVPPVNRAANDLGQEIFGGRTSNRKVPLADFQTAPNQLERRRELGQQAFEALVWALAPMATNQPLGHGITPAQVADPNAYASRTNYHYGGGENGPAAAMQDAFNFSNPEIGPAYALLRAASMVANLVAGSNRPADPAAYNSTIARLYPRHQYPSQSGLTTAPAVNDHVIPLTMRFSHGDIGDSLEPETLLQLMPVELVGNAVNGVSLIGLQHQPYIVEATSFAAYTARPDLTTGEAVPQTNPEVEDADNITNERIGAGFAIELRNPWPEEINLAPYHVRIANDNGFIQIGLDQVDTGDGSGTLSAPILQPGRSMILYVESESGFAGFTQIWEPIRDRWREVIEDRENEPIVQQVARLETDAILPGGSATSGVFFQNLGRGDAATVMLVATDTVNDVEVLVDRLAPPEGSMNFPATIVSAQHEFDPGPPPRAGTARWSIASTLYRPTDNSNPRGGFPGYVVERRQNNVLEVSENILIPWQMLPEADPESLPAPGPDWSELVDRAFDGDVAGIDSLLGEEKGVVGNLPAFQLFVPRGPLAYASELHMLSVFAHTYKHGLNSNIELLTAHRAPSLTLPTANLGAIGADDDYWLTVGEQLGADWHLAYRTDEPVSGSNINPYLGVLDPTRFVLQSNDTNTGDLGVVDNLPDTMALPLALRVFDPFEALTTVSPLVNGRININTAPAEVLDLIPFMTIGQQSPSPLENNNEIRRQLVLNYRFDINPDIHTPAFYSHLDGPPSTSYPMSGRREDMTGIPGLRDVPPNRKINGLVSTGELAVLDVWDAMGNPLAGNNARGFLELGKNGVPSAAPFVMRDRVFNSQGDPEKRLAAFRAMSNIVTTRSDVFTMTFVIRGYSPEAIEDIRIDPSDPDSPNNPDQALDRLAPTFEQRWLAMFDRSNVRRPTDRPRVLLLVELPHDQAQVVATE